MNQMARQVRCMLWHLAGDKASEIAEAALVMPLAFMILLGIYWFGRAFNTYSTINDAAREGARVAIAQTCASGPPACSSPNASASPATIDSTVTAVLKASAVDPSQIITPTTPTVTSCSGAANPCSSTPGGVMVCSNIQVTPPSANQPVCGVSVSFQYPYQFWLPFTSLNMQRITLTTDVQMTGEY